MTPRYILLCSAAIAALSACSSGSSSSDPDVTPDPGVTPDPVGPEFNRLAGNSSDELVRAETFGTVSIVGPNGSSSMSVTTDPTITIPEGFSAYQRIDDGERTAFAFRGVSPSGNGITGVFRSTPESALLPGFGAGSAFGAFSERVGETVLPASGSVEYTGGYAGIYRNTSISAFADIRYAISGNAAMTVDFDDNEASGAITDRVAISLDSGDDITMSDVDLQLTSISGGAFEGDISGGEWEFLYPTETTGIYGGLIVGDSGEEIVGNTYIVHTQDVFDSGTFSEAGEEYGTFILTD